MGEIDSDFNASNKVRNSARARSELPRRQMAFVELWVSVAAIHTGRSGGIDITLLLPGPRTIAEAEARRPHFHGDKDTQE
jgi:hypothetical protein